MYDPFHHDGEDNVPFQTWKRDTKSPMEVIQSWSKIAETHVTSTFSSEYRMAEEATLLISEPWGRVLNEVFKKELAGAVDKNRRSNIEKTQDNYFIPWDNFVTFMVKFDSKWYLI